MTIVYNPTSLTQKLFTDLKNYNLFRGSFGIGKSFSLRNFNYLSYHRFRLLHGPLLQARLDYIK